MKLTVTQNVRKISGEGDSQERKRKRNDNWNLNELGDPSEDDFRMSHNPLLN